MAAAIVALGWISFTKLPITRMPNVDVPVISVTITQFGAAPAELESRVTKAVEDAVSGLLVPITSTPSSPMEYPTRRSYFDWKRIRIARSMMSRTR
jgi:multidrug efflux pump subunit AcrB